MMFVIEVPRYESRFMQMTVERVTFWGDVPLSMRLWIIVQCGSHKRSGQKRRELFQQSYTTTGEERVNVTGAPEKVVQ